MLYLIDSSSSSLTVTWKEVSNAKKYVLQYKKGGGGGAHDDDGNEIEFELLSNKLKSTQAKKKNLNDPENVGFYFRVAAITEETDNKEEEIDYTKLSWITHPEPFYLLSEKDEESNNRMNAPIVITAGNYAVLISWNNNNKEDDGASSSYELQMRENDGGIPWKTITSSSFKGTCVRKKNLTSTLGYQFRVRRNYQEEENKNNDDDTSSPYFSPPSNVIVAYGLYWGIRNNLFNTLENGNLIKNDMSTIPLDDALGGKEFILLYASAHWCGPCRSYTPKLIQWYNNMIKSNINIANSIEILFLSADHDENSFKEYFKSMPWLSIDYDDDTREHLMSYIKVSGIPRLVVMDGKTGKILINNAVGQQLDINSWRKLASSSS